EVAGRGVARGAFAGAVEVGAAGVGVAGGEVGGLDRAASSAELREFFHLAVGEGDDGAQLGFRETGEGGHAGVGTSGANHGSELIAAGVLRDEFGAGEVGAGFATGGVFAVAESALRSEADFALADLFGGVGLLCRFGAGLRRRALALPL